MVLDGLDVVYDCVGSEESSSKGLRWTRTGGSVVIVGLHMSPIKKHRSISRLVLACGSDWLVHARRNEWNGKCKHDYERVFKFYRLGKFDISGLITYRFPWKDYKEAMRVASHKGCEKAIKVFLEHA